jgi:hypothetical protein
MLALIAISFPLRNACATSCELRYVVFASFPPEIFSFPFNFFFGPSAVQ